VTLSSTDIAVTGVRSPVMQAGPPDATEAVVFVHGNPGPADDWTDLLTRVGAFARDCPEMPGPGTDKPRNFAIHARVLRRSPRTPEPARPRGRVAVALVHAEREPQLRTPGALVTAKNSVPEPFASCTRLARCSDSRHARRALLGTVRSGTRVTPS
jgi:hypothetical protein